MDASPSPAGSSSGPVVSVRGLSYRYPGASAPAVQELTFDIKKGEIFGLLGPSGTGKSTTQKLLTGLLRGYDGEMEVLGRPLDRWGGAYYEHIGVSFELPAAYRKLTAVENLAFFAALYERTTLPPRALLERLGLGASADERTATFSKGMHARLNLARALLHQPELLFLDEPTAGLDPSNVHLVAELLVEQRAAGRTLLLATHDMSVAQKICDRVAFIVDGRIGVIDSPRTLRQRFGARTVQVGYRRNGLLSHREFPLDELADARDFASLLRSGDVETLHSQEAELGEVYRRLAGGEAQTLPRGVEQRPVASP